MHKKILHTFAISLAFAASTTVSMDRQYDEPYSIGRFVEQTPIVPDFTFGSLDHVTYSVDWQNEETDSMSRQRTKMNSIGRQNDEVYSNDGWLIEQTPYVPAIFALGSFAADSLKMRDTANFCRVATLFSTLFIQ